MITIESQQQFDKLIHDEDAILVYFSHEQCNVCKVLKPKIADLIDKEFPKIKIAYSDTEKFPEIAGQKSIFTVPTILVYFTGREYIRASRNISVLSLSEQIDRPYSMLFTVEN